MTTQLTADQATDGRGHEHGGDEPDGEADGGVDDRRAERRPHRAAVVAGGREERPDVGGRLGEVGVEVVEPAAVPTTPTTRTRRRHGDRQAPTTPRSTDPAPSWSTASGRSPAAHGSRRRASTPGDGVDEADGQAHDDGEPPRARPRRSSTATGSSPRRDRGGRRGTHRRSPRAAPPGRRCAARRTAPAAPPAPAPR